MTDNNTPRDEGADDDLVRALITTPIHTAAGDPYGLEWLFLRWAWEAGYHDWNKAVRALARALRGLERIGLVERRTIRRANDGAHHGFVLTDEGRAALSALSGDGIRKAGDAG